MEIYKNLMYVSTPLESHGELAERLTVDKKIYYRYMDKIYIPETPSNLSMEDVSALSEIRIKLNGEVIDYSYTKELIATLIGKLDGSPIKNIIDFGCGGGILAEVLTNGCYTDQVMKVIGLDISDFAVSSSSKSYEVLENIEHEAFLFNGSNSLNIESNSIDAIFSSFVMHFPIYENQLEELYRVLKIGGGFVYNDYVYNKYPSHTKKIINRLKYIGFKVHEETIKFFHPETKDLKLHKIITAVK